jgi:hypothetical protein
MPFGHRPNRPAPVKALIRWTSAASRPAMPRWPRPLPWSTPPGRSAQTDCPHPPSPSRDARVTPTTPGQRRSTPASIAPSQARTASQVASTSAKVMLRSKPDETSVVRRICARRGRADSSSSQTRMIRRPLRELSMPPRLSLLALPSRDAARADRRPAHAAAASAADQARPEAADRNGRTPAGPQIDCPRRDGCE